MDTFDRTLFEGASAFNTIVVTEDSSGLRSLWFGEERVRQSVVKVGVVDHLESPYPPVILVGFALLEHLRSALIIGLGGGVIPSFLRAHFPRMRIDVVEIDPVVVDVAKRFCGFREDDQMRVHVDDGRRFLERCEDRYDAIVLDSFGAHGTPSHMLTCEFLKSVRGALSQEGMAISNVWSSDANPYYACTVTTYKDVFESLYLMDVQDFDNRIFFALPRPSHLTDGAVEERARAFSARHRFPFDLGALAGKNFRSAEEESGGGSVLRDPGGAW